MCIKFQFLQMLVEVSILGWEREDFDSQVSKQDVVNRRHKLPTSWDTNSAGRLPLCAKQLSQPWLLKAEIPREGLFWYLIQAMMRKKYINSMPFPKIVVQGNLKMCKVLTFNLFHIYTTFYIVFVTFLFLISGLFFQTWCITASVSSFAYFYVS